MFHLFKNGEMSMEIPKIGLGTWKLTGKECEETVRKALDLGYRHIDTADVYQNHQEIAKAIKGFPRKELFICSKIMGDDLDPKRVKKATLRFLDELETNYLDLLLIHWPLPGMDIVETVRAMMAVQEEGLTKLIGVSNFVRSHLQLLEGFPIATNQIELHPYYQRRALVAMCEKMGISLTAYRPVAKGAFETDQTMLKIGRKLGKTPSQIALKWLLQKGYIVIPKASNLKHLKDNISLDFELSPEEMETIDHLEKGQRYTQSLVSLED